MAEELGSLAVKIGLDSSGFQNGISNINRNLRVLDSEFKANTTALGENAKGIDGLKLKSESLSKQLELQKQKVSALEQAYNKSAETKGKDSKATQELEIKLNKAKQALSQMENELSKANKEIEVQSSKWTVLGKSLDGVTSKMKSVGEGLGNVGSKLSLGLTAPLLAAGTASVSLASDMSESTNKVEVAFGSCAKTVEDWSSTTLKSFGIAKGTALDMSSLYGDMATSMGLNQEEASKMSMSLVGLAGDLSSFKNINTKQAEDALNGIFTGETESLKMLGVVMTDANLQQYAYSKGIQKKTQTMTESEKVQLRYNYVMEKTKNAHGDFERTGAGTANQMRVFKESLKELGATMGQNILPIITPIIAKLNEWIQAFGRLDQGTQKTILVIGAIVAAIGPVLVGISTLILSVKNITTAFGTVSTAIGKLGGMSKILGVMFNPWVIGIGIAILAGYEIYKHWDGIKAKAAELCTSITTIFNNIKTDIINAWTYIKENVINLCGNIKEGAISIWNSLLDWFSELPSKLYNHGSQMFTQMKDGVNSTIGNVKSSIETGINSALSYLASLPDKAWSYGADFVQGIVNGIKSAVGKVEDAVSGLAAKIRSYLHFSVPDEGPLADYESWMPDFMSGLAEGINKSKSLVSESIKGLALDMKVNTKVVAMALPSNNNSGENHNTSSRSGLTLHIENFNNYTEKDIEQLAYELEFYRQRIAMGKGGV